MSAPKSTLQSRTKSRARRLGLEVKGSYTRGQARSIKRRLAAKRGSNGSGGAAAPAPSAPRSSAGTADTSLPGRQNVGVSAVNQVSSGAGSERQGKRYQVGYDSDAGKFYHRYGKKKRVYLSDSVASGYGYKRSS